MPLGETAGEASISSYSIVGGAFGRRPGGVRFLIFYRMGGAREAPERGVRFLILGVHDVLQHLRRDSARRYSRRYGRRCGRAAAEIQSPPLQDVPQVGIQPVENIAEVPQIRMVEKSGEGPEVRFIEKFAEALD